VDCPRGKSIICAFSCQPMFRSDGSVDLEITFLATRMTVEGSGMALWLIRESLITLSTMKIKNVYVQSCTGFRTLTFYHKLGEISTLLLTFTMFRSSYSLVF